MLLFNMFVWKWTPKTYCHDMMKYTDREERERERWFSIFCSQSLLRSCPESRMTLRFLPHCWLWFLGQGSFWIRGSSEARKYSVTVQVQHISKIPIFHVQYMNVYSIYRGFVWMHQGRYTLLKHFEIADAVMSVMNLVDRGRQSSEIDDFRSQHHVFRTSLFELSTMAWIFLGFWATAPVRSTPSLATFTRK